MSELKQTLSDIVKALVDDPDEISVIEIGEDDNDVTLELTVAPDDTGKVIGRHGRIAKAIRTVMKAAGINAGKRVNVEIK